ncbi:MAG TPA: hypothetical protein VLV86_06835, partial [Vicinamibacterales bacterium]|nr:hypothetical protein [Vicinamibacterales bacterium]
MSHEAVLVKRFLPLAAGAFLCAILATGCSSSTTTPSAVTPSPFVMTWGSLVFPTTGVGSASPTPVLVTLWNNGTSAVPVTSVSNSNPAEFPFSTTCQVAGSLAPSSTCTVTTQFKPNALGARSGTLTITANGATQTLALSGTGATVSPQVVLTPAGDVAPNVFTLSGTGFTPSATAELHTIYTPAAGNPPNPVPVTTWAVDASGNVTATTTTTAPGTYEQWLLDV